MNAHYICFIALEEELEYLNERLVHFGFYNKSGGYIPGRQAYQYSKKDTRSGGKIDLTVYPNREMGNIGSAVRVNTELREKNFQAAFIVGIAGSLDVGRHNLGNVVVSSSSKFLSPDKLFETDVDVETLKRVGTNNAFRFRRDFIELEKRPTFSTVTSISVETNRTGLSRRSPGNSLSTMMSCFNTRTRIRQSSMAAFSVRTGS